MEHRQLTLMFTDIVGYSRLMGRDQAQTIAMLEDYRRILVEEIDKQQGTVIEFIGDAVFARFETPGAGVNAAIAIQKALFAFNHFRDKSLPRLQTRIGLHTGEVATKDDAVFGDDVNIAARLEPIAVADGICVSEQVYQAVKSDLKEPVLSLGVQPLKNIQSKVRAYLIRPLGINLRIRGHYLNRRFNEKVGAYRYAIAASVLFLILAGIYYVPRWLVPGYDANYVEIADFQNLMNEGGEADYLSAGISEAVRAQLADMKDVYVLKTGEGVQAPLMIEGSVQKLGGNLRIAYQLKRRDGDVQIAGGKLDGKYDEIFILQDRVVGEIATYLASEFDIPNFRPARIDTTSDVLAYEYYLRGLEYLNRPNSTKNADEAIKFFSTALIHDTKYASAEASLCLAYRKKYATSNDTQWLNIAEERCAIALEIDPSLDQALLAMGKIYTDLGEYQKAIDTLSAALELDSNNYSTNISLGLAYYYAGKTQTALKTISKAINMDPLNYRGFEFLGWIYLSSGELSLAEQALNEGLKITPHNNALLNSLGNVYTYMGKFEKALEVFEEAVQIVPSSWGYSNIGFLNYYSGHFEKASNNFNLAMTLDPKDYVLRMNYADSLRQIPGDQSSTKQHYKKVIKQALLALDVNPHNTEAIYATIMSYLSLGDVERAEEKLSAAIHKSTDNIDLLYAKVRIHALKNDLDQAFLALQQLLDTGYSRELIDRDPDLAILRKDDDYSLLVSRVQ